MWGVLTPPTGRPLPPTPPFPAVELAAAPLTVEDLETEEKEVTSPGRDWETVLVTVSTGRDEDELEADDEEGASDVLEGVAEVLVDVEVEVDVDVLVLLGGMELGASDDASDGEGAADEVATADDVGAAGGL
jgi:hypothetical protein